MVKFLCPQNAGGDNMKAPSAIVITCLIFGSVLSGSESLDRARQLSKSGDTSGARTLLAQAARSNPNDITSLSEYADFLDRYGDPGARAAYGKLLDALSSSSDSTRRAAIAKRLITLDLQAGDRSSAEKHFQAFQAAGGTGLAAPGGGSASAAQNPARQTVSI